ncbi:MAG TPA: DUF1501 domain-containing protein [Oculatellaceae cyanobacterium]
MTLTRRDFLKSGLAVAGVCLSWSQACVLASQAAKLAPRQPGSGKVLVLVQLAGGNDGLNTVIPYGNGAYHQARPAIGIKDNEVLALNGQIGLHPSMKTMADLYRQGKVAVLLGLGYPGPNRSHFRSIEIWQTANPERIIDTGWLGRYLDLASASDRSDGNIFPAVNVDPILPKTFSSEKVVIPSVYDVNQFRFATDAHYQQDHKCQLEAFNKIYSDFNLQRPGIELLRGVGQDTLQASDYLYGAVKSYQGTVNYPDTGFARSLKFIAQMIVAGVSATVYNVSLGGFDTHSNQLNTQARLLQQLSDGLTAFQKDIEQHQLDRDVITMTFSEFGRRVGQNNGNGTDHGTAAPHFVLGSAVRGGIYGDYPSLSNLDSGDLKYKIDFRNMYATILDRWLGADSREVLGGKFDDIRFV